MSQLSIPLNPVARPTDQYVAPRLNQPSQQSASDLSQLAGALRQIAPEVGQVLARRQQASNEGAQARANQDFMQRRYANLKDLKGEVDAGRVAEADNPWYMVQLRQDVAANQAADAVRQTETDWENSPVRFSDDPKEVETWVKANMAPATDDMDAYEAEAAAPIVQNGVSQVVGRHLDIRRQERQEERIANFQTRVGNLLTSPDQKAATGQLQSLISEARLTMNGAQVNALVIRAATDSAQATGDEGVLSMLSSIPNTGAGGTLADHPDVKQLKEQLPLMRMRRSLELDRMNAAQDKARQEALEKAVDDHLMKVTNGHPEKGIITPEDAAKLGLSSDFVITHNSKATNYGEMLDTQGEKQAVLVDKANAREAKALQGQAEANLATGKWKVTDPEVIDTMARLAAKDPDAANQFNRYLSDRHDMDGWGKRIYARESNPQTESDLWTAAKANKLTLPDLIKQSENLTHDSFSGLLHEITKKDPEQKLSAYNTDGKWDERIKDMVVFGAMRSNETSYDMASKDPEVQSRVLRAQVQMNKAAQSLFNQPDFMSLPRDEQETRLDAVLESSAKSFGGLGYAERDKKIAEDKAAEAQASKEAEVRLRPIGEMTTKNGVTDVNGGKSFGAPSLLTDDQRGFVRDLRNTLGGDPLGEIYKNPRNPGQSDASWDYLNRLGGLVGLSFQKDPVDRTTAYLRAYLVNARALNGGGLQSQPALDVADPQDGFTKLHLMESGYAANVGQSAKILFESQRNKLADIRKDIEARVINPKTHSELLRLSQDLHAQKQAGKTPSPTDVERFRELDSYYRLHDFLSVTAGIMPQDAAKDWTLLTKYPAASDEEGLKALIPLIHARVPEDQREDVLRAQRALIARAQKLLQNGTFSP